MTRASPIARQLVPGVVSFLVCVSAFAQSPRVAEFNPLNQLKQAELKVAAKRLEAAALPDTADVVNKRFGLLSSPLDRLGVERSFVGDADGAIDALDEARRLSPRPFSRPARPEVLAQIETTVPRDALAAIVKEARTRQVVILNENHHMPLHRAFAMRLARELRKLGYTHLAAETFDPEIMAKPFVDTDSGFYTSEPVFANFVRDAAKDGWKFVDYETDNAEDTQPGQTMEERIKRRELGQARNLVDRILAKNPKAKVFIYVGYGHGAKATFPGGSRMMADYFKELSGIDPLTIDQSLMFAHPRPDAEHSLYRAMAKKGGDQPFVLANSEGKYQVFASPAGAYDMQVVHPAWPIDSQNGRRAWLSALAGFKPQPVPTALLPASGRRLVMAMRPNAAVGEAPLDAVLLEAGKKAPMLMLPDGPFELTSRDEPGAGK